MASGDYLARTIATVETVAVTVITSLVYAPVHPVSTAMIASKFAPPGALARTASKFVAAAKVLQAAIHSPANASVSLASRACDVINVTNRA